MYLSKLLSLVMLALLVISCSSDENNENNNFDLSPPGWIIGTWMSSPTYGFKFVSNDIIYYDITTEMSFVEERNQALAQGYDYILKDELETETEYWVLTEKINTSTGNTFSKIWKWRKNCDNAIERYDTSEGSFYHNENTTFSIPEVDFVIDLNLPEYDPLNFPGNSIIIESEGVKGIVVYNVNNELYTAFEISDPNHIPNECSIMSIWGIIATCPCQSDDNSYDIVTGQHQNNGCSYSMYKYSAIRNGDVILLTNL